MRAATKGRAKPARPAAAKRHANSAHRSTRGLRVAVADQQSLLDVDHARLSDAVRRVLASEGITAAEISVAVVDDVTIHKLNRDYLAHDCPTDVITFSLGEAHGPLEGEIVVSAETACHVAASHDAAPADELLLYVIHGALHLAGYDDLSQEPRRRMRAREQHYLAELGIELAPVDRAKKKMPSRGVRGGKTSRRSTNGTHGASAT